MYEDEVIIKQSGSTVRTWAPKGEGTQVKSFPGRKSVKALGAVSAETDPKFYFRFVERFNTETFGAFLKQIVSRNPHRKVHLILDNVRYHHAKALKPWLEKNEKAIELHFLPPYSPNLNPIERVWKETKKKSIHNRFFPTLITLHAETFRRFNRFQGNPASLRNLVN